MATASTLTSLYVTPVVVPLNSPLSAKTDNVSKPPVIAERLSNNLKHPLVLVSNVQVAIVSPINSSVLPLDLVSKATSDVKTVLVVFSIVSVLKNPLSVLPKNLTSVSKAFVPRTKTPVLTKMVAIRITNTSVLLLVNVFKIGNNVKITII
jgi:hypothetical protein